MDVKQDTDNANCRELLNVMIAQGVDTIVLSPGSRNTPILIGASARDELRKIIITDERTAAFVALGIGIASKKPVALACTSGTALYNYAPAIAEAYYQQIPLVVITADRPSQWIGQDDSQTLNQYNALSNIVKRSYNIYAETGITIQCANPEYRSEKEWSVNRIANEAMLVCKSGNPGPVHINIQFPEPLAGTIDYKKSIQRTIEFVNCNTHISSNVALEIATRMLQKRIMVIAGFMLPDNSLNKTLSRFANLPNVTILCETISNLHISGRPYMIDSLLSRIDGPTKISLKPDIVISIGGSLVSRMLKDYIRKSKDIQHWTLSDTDVSSDCFQHLSTHFEAKPEIFFRSVGNKISHLIKKGHTVEYKDYNAKWQDLRNRVWHKNMESIAEASRWSELKALHYLFQSIPENYNLFLSNGTCIRYAQLLLDKIPHACYCNRGVSGIDGTNATALGVSLEYKGTTLLVTGDMSFAYDTSILNYQKIGGDLRIIVVNNSGGGIFRFIRSTRDLPIREEYFCSDPQLSIQKLANAYGWNYYSATNEHSLKTSFESLLGNKKSILEIIVDPQSSAKQLINWMEAL